MIDQTEMKDRYRVVRDEINEAAAAAGRDPDDINLVAVSKFHPAERVLEAVGLGMTCFGENQVQELVAKAAEVASAGLQPSWHMIGTLQRNKVRQVVGLVDLIHSVDSDRLLKEIDKRAGQKACRQAVLLQINYSGAGQKHGYSPTAARDSIVELLPTLPHVSLQGIMTMAEPDWTETETDAFYRDFAAYYQELKVTTGLNLPILSMGMSGDFQIAIRHGATHIRIGTSIFGQREY